MTWANSGLFAVLLTAGALIGSAAPSDPSGPARVHLPKYTVTENDDETHVLAQLSTDSTAATHSSGPAVRQAVATAPVLQKRLVPACATNSPDSNADALCAAATQVCATMGQQGISFWLFTRPLDGSQGWRMAGQLCLHPEDAAAVAAAAVPVVTAEQFRRLPWPPAVVHIQPGNGRTLVNVPTNVYLEATVREVPTVMLGQQVRVRATPISYAWTFGDGTVLRTADPGAPYPDLRTTHVYTRSGTMPVGLTTTYRGEYSVAGGGWLPVDGTAQVVTPPVGLTVVAARSELVASPLPR